jgi:hypothetical protein
MSSEFRIESVEIAVPEVSCWPLGAVPLDGVSTAAIEGDADEMWLQTVDGRAEAAAVNAMASGSQHRIVSAGWPQSGPGSLAHALFRPSDPPWYLDGLGALYGLPARPPPLHPRWGFPAKCGRVWANISLTCVEMSWSSSASWSSNFSTKSRSAR